MSKQQERLDRIKAAEREYQAAVLAAMTLRAALRKDPGLLDPPLTPADVLGLVKNLEATFLMRLFAEFEAGLRDVWANWCKKVSLPKAEDLLNSLAARRGVPDAARNNAHAVRKYRNALVHEGSETADPIPMDRARKYLCTFFGRMPLDW
jgi:hypothetical protein